MVILFTGNCSIGVIKNRIGIQVTNTTQTEALAILNACKARIDGPLLIALKSGMLASSYVDCDRLFPHTNHVKRIAQLLLRGVADFDVVAGPAVGGIPIAQQIAQIRTTPYRGGTTPFVWADKTSSGLAFERAGFTDLLFQKRVLVVEDVSTTGSSAKAVCDAVRDAGGEVVGISMIWNRGELSSETFGSPLHSLINLSIPTYEPEDHPHWMDPEYGLVTNLGHSDAFLERYPDYPTTTRV